MGTSVVRPLAVAHGGYSNPLQLRDSCKQGAERRPDRQRGKRCTVGSPHQNLNDVVAEKPQRCTVGSHPGMKFRRGRGGSAVFPRKRISLPAPAHYRIDPASFWGPKTMATAQLGSVLRHLRQLAGLRTYDDMTDGQLLGC